MKWYKRRSLIYKNPHAILVGHSGKIRRDDRLLPLRMTRKYKELLKQEEESRNEKIWTMSSLFQKHENLTSIINSVMKEDNSNSRLLLELERQKTTCKKQLLQLESQLVCVPETLNESMQNIFNRKSKCRHSNKTRRPVRYMESEVQCSEIASVNFKRIATGQGCKQSKTRLLPKQPAKSANNVTNSSRFASVKSQILVRDSDLQLQAVNIDLFSNGENLLHVLATELGLEVKDCKVMFGTKQVETSKTLWEQGIYHGTTIDLIVQLQGGMERKKKKKNKKNKRSISSVTAATEDRLVVNGPEDKPELWTKKQVCVWLEKTCKELEFDEETVSKLKLLNGKALSMLLMEDWKERSPDCGDVLFRMWETLKGKPSDRKTETEELSVHLDEKCLTSVVAAEEKPSLGEGSRNSTEPKISENINVQDDVNDSMASGLFGKVDNLEDLKGAITLYDVANNDVSVNPEMGSDVFITGVCSGKPQRRGSVVTLLIRDDPPGAVSHFNHVKIEIRGNDNNEELHLKAVETISENIKSDVSVALRGRVEQLEGEWDSAEPVPAHEMLKFKLVVDSDHHAFVYVEKKTVSLTRQLSQRWYVQQGTYSAVVDDKEVHVGDKVKKMANRIFCKSSVSVEEIQKFAIAFKNSFDGDIFIGVEEDGKITGMEFSEGNLSKWREDVTKTIGQILPSFNEGVSIFTNNEKARESFGKRCFVSVMRLDEPQEKDIKKINGIAWIHVPKGGARVYFSKQSDVYAFVRVGAENKRLTDYEDLFSRLYSLYSRRVTPIADKESYIERQYKKATEKMKCADKYQVFNAIKFEHQEREFKMIFGDKPVDTIEKKYLPQYTCGFLNSSGGTIFFGVQEDEDSKVGHVIGIEVTHEEREKLGRTLVKTLSEFYPPVNASEYHITFHDVSVPAKLILRYPDTYPAKSGKCVLLRGPPDEIGKKWPKFIKGKLEGKLCRVIHVQPQCFCIVTKKVLDPKQYMEIVEIFTKDNSKISLDAMENSKVKSVLESLCVVQLKVNRSPYPIHMIKPIETFVLDEHGTLNQLSQQELMFRFALDSTSEFDVNTFLQDVEDFSPSGNSYVLIASPFNLPDTERDLYGLVIPKWTLTIDFDQHPKEQGHLYQIFQNLNDLHQPERARFLKTPKDQKLELNPDHGVCWLAARGYEEIAESLSEGAHGKWNMTHRRPLASLLEAEFTSHVKLNYLKVVVLWDKGHHGLVDSLRAILEDIISINGDRTAVTFVCSTLEAQSDINNKLVEPLQEDYWEIMQKERVYVASPHVLAQFLAYKLPAPYRPEDDYQIPHKKCNRQPEQIIPETLDKQLRQNIHGHLEMMYMTKERKPDELTLRKARLQFYSGSKITELGLRSMIGIKRSKLAALERAFQNLSNDKRSYVSSIFVKADRGAGTTTMCLQFLFQHHEKIPCAQLLEVGSCLVGHIEKINKVTKLPLLLLVDEEIAQLQEFLDFKKEVEARKVYVIFLLIGPAEALCKRPPTQRKSNNTQNTSSGDLSLYGTSPYKSVELRRELKVEEMEDLTEQLTAIDKENKKKLQKLVEKARYPKMSLSFAHFSLTAFGKNFKGLKQYVEFGLDFADDKQKDVLAFLSLTHVFTDYLFPTSALSSFLETKKVNLDREFESSYLRELLSPRLDDSDSRRISFLEVAEEILEQLAGHSPSTSNSKQYWSFIKRISVKMAKYVLICNIGSKKIDRLTRKLFVTSEYESEKFPLLIRSMKDAYPDTARDTLLELVGVFHKHTSFRAHLLAHLAKYYMSVYNSFDEAKPLIEEAIKEQDDDGLLYHIHGDIIRLHVQALKNREVIDMDSIVSHAIESSECFKIVRRKRPHVSHGYFSDAMVRITVMQAAIKKMGGEEEISFVDFLIRMVDDIKKRGEDFSINERYLLSLIPDAHQYLDENVIDIKHKDRWKDNFLKCIGDATNLNKLYDKLKGEESSFGGWFHDITLGTQILYYAFEIESKELSQEKIKSRIEAIDHCGLSSRFSEWSMKFWIRHVRKLDSVPSLEAVNKKIKKWISLANKKGGISPHAEFYKFVVSVLIAVKDPTDREKMDQAVQLITRRNKKKYDKREKFNDALPLEWLHARERHIDSIDSLLSHDDLVKELKNPSKPGREVIEGILSDKNITKWEGTVKGIKSEWHGTIVFKKHLDVSFVPQNVQPGMPKDGDTVQFCLSFSMSGLCAWSVKRLAWHSLPVNSFEIERSDESSASEESENNEETNENIVPPDSFFSMDMPEARPKNWDSHSGQRMQGIVSSTHPEKGYGFLIHPDICETLFFHAAQLNDPVKSLEGTIIKDTVLEFMVEKLPDRTRAADIRVLKIEDSSPVIQEHLALIRSQRQSSPSISRREKRPRNPDKTLHMARKEKGVIAKLCKDGSFGFIKPDSSCHGTDSLFFHHTYLSNQSQGSVLNVGDRVQFCVSQTMKGLEANDIDVQSQRSPETKWEHFIDRGIQEGFVWCRTDKGGIIHSPKVSGPGENLHFYYNDIIDPPFVLIEGAKVHFEVEKRGRRCLAVKINVIRNPEAMVHPGLAVSMDNQGGIFRSYPELSFAHPHMGYLRNLEPHTYLPHDVEEF